MVVVHLLIAEDKKTIGHFNDFYVKINQGIRIIVFNKLSHTTIVVENRQIAIFTVKNCAYTCIPTAVFELDKTIGIATSKIIAYVIFMYINIQLIAKSVYLIKQQIPV